MTSHSLLLLPPSESNSDGGSRVSESVTEAAADRSAETAMRACAAAVQRDLITLSHGDADEAARALKISTRLAEVELARNRALADAPRKPAVERYTGVLYDALDAASLDAPAREWLGTHVRIHSALYGLVPALEPIAAYRLSHNSRLPGATLKRRWAGVLSEVLAAHHGPILDLRSKGYVDLGPLPAGPERVWGEVVERLADGTTRSLNHFNKRAKGALVRAIAQRAPQADELATIAQLGELVADRFSFEPLDATTVRIVVRRA